MARVLGIAEIAALCLVLLWRTSSGYSLTANVSRHIAARADDPFVAFLRNLLTNARLQLPKGIPALGVPPLDPLVLGGLYLDESPIEGFLDLEGDLGNLTVTGVADFEVAVLKFTGLPLKPQLQLTLNWPQLALTGHYNLRGKFSTSVNFAGNGPFSIKVKSISFTADILLHLKSGLKVGVTHVILDLKIKSVIAYFHNVLGGGIAESIANRLLSSMIQNQFNSKLRPQVQKAGESIKETLEKLLDSI